MTSHRKSVSKALIPGEKIAQQILVIHSQKVLLDMDLAELYGVETKALVRAVRRNQDRFPDDFMFQLTTQEVIDLRGQNWSPKIWGGRPLPPFPLPGRKV